MLARRRLAALAVAAAMGMGSQMAWAGDPAGAEALFRAGKEALDAARFDEACDKLRQSQSLDPAPGTLWHLARCEEGRGRIATAWALYDELAQKLPASDERRAGVVAKRAELEPRLPRLVLRLAPGAPQDASVRRGEAVVGSAGMGVALPVDPGKHTLVVTAPGRVSAELSFAIAVGETKEIIVAPGPVEPPTEKPSAPAPVHGDTSTPPEPSTWPAQKVIGVAALGAGAIGLGVGAAFGLMSMSAHDDAAATCPAPNPCGDRDAAEAWSDATTAGSVSTVAFVAGGVLAAAGAVLWITAPSPGRAEVGVGPAGARVRFQF